MCGITGLISRAPLSPAQIGKARELNERLRHRGPDGDGEHRDTQVMLAMRRLSIIDLATGWQPLYNEDRTLSLVANEVYNYAELRRTLEARGHRYATGSGLLTLASALAAVGGTVIGTAAVGFAVGNLLGATLFAQYSFGLIGNLTSSPWRDFAETLLALLGGGYVGLALFASDALRLVLSSTRNVILGRLKGRPAFASEPI